MVHFPTMEGGAIAPGENRKPQSTDICPSRAVGGYSPWEFLTRQGQPRKPHLLGAGQLVPEHRKPRTKLSPEPQKSGRLDGKGKQRYNEDEGCSFTLKDPETGLQSPFTTKDTHLYFPALQIILVASQLANALVFASGEAHLPHWRCSQMWPHPTLCGSTLLPSALSGISQSM